MIAPRSDADGVTGERRPLRVELVIVLAVTFGLSAVTAALQLTDSVLRGLHAVLRPGAPLVVHDYSLAGPLRRWIWHAVSWGVIIPAGRLATGDTGLYRHLWRSVLDFDDPVAFRDRLRRAGYRDVRAGTVPGWQRGIVHTFRARRPDTPEEG